MGIKVSTELLEKIDRLVLSPRAASIKEKYFDEKIHVATERLRLTTESAAETEGEPVILRRAKLLKKIAENNPCVIFPQQLIVGNSTKYFRGVNPHVDYNGLYLLPLLKEEKGQITTGGPVEKGLISEDDYPILLEAIQFWKGKTAAEKVEETVKPIMGSWYDDLVEAGTQRRHAIPNFISVVNWDRILADGLLRIKEEAETALQRWTDSREDDTSKRYFWEAAIIALEATLTLSKRYAKVARQMAAAENDPARRAELEEIARTCEWVPANPARTFREAVQSIIIISLSIGMEVAGQPCTGWGPIDQYLYPFFKRDLEEGRLTLEKAADLMADWLMWSERQEVSMDFTYREHFQKGKPCSMALGGPDRQGSDATNELSYFVLHMAGLVRTIEPHIVIRWHRETPSWFMLKAMETNLKVGGGVPQFQNAEHTVQYMLERGVSIENARYFHTYGCSQCAPADSPTPFTTSYINIPLCMDLALHNGVSSKSGKKIGMETGDPRTFESFEELYDAFQKQVEFVTRKQLWHDRLADRVRMEYFPEVLASALLPGCIEKGKEFTAGGLPHYAIEFKKDRGIVAAADSLLAVKKLVYDEKKISMEKLLQALDMNFESDGGEEIRQMCLAVPKYGNDDDEPDTMVRDVAKFSGNVILSEKNFFGWPYAINRNGQGWHFMAGKRLAALPNGRKAGEPLYDGSLSPMQGVDRNGPTALLNSVLKADFKESMAGILNVKLPATLLESAESREKVISMTENFFRAGGTYIQYNVINADILMEAKRNPEKFKDLVIRVGGYSAYFVNLSPEIQDEIIRRTEHVV